MAAERAQLAVEQGEMHRLVCRDRQEIVGEAAPHIFPEPSDDIERQIDRHEFDMRQCMPQGDTALLRPGLAAARHFARRKQ